MSGRIAATVIVAFAATSAFAGHSSGGHSSGGHSSGGHSSGGHSSGGHSSGGHSSGGHSSGPHASGRHSSGTHASATQARSGYTHSSGLSDAQRRQPRPGQRRGARYHVRGYYPYYANSWYDPYYRSYSYYPYAWGYRGLGVGFSVDNGYYAPYDYGYDSAYGPDPRDREDRSDDDAYADRDERRDGRGAQSQGAALRTGGELRLTLRPTDATVYVDGEFRGTALQARTLWLASGHHRVEMVRPGFQTAERDVDVSPGSPALLEVDLERP